jgi:K+-dependent Na+/Ca+ exchanger-like protein
MLIFALAVPVYESMEPYLLSAHRLDNRGFAAAHQLQFPDASRRLQVLTCLYNRSYIETALLGGERCCDDDKGDEGGAFPPDPIIPMRGTPKRYKHAPAGNKVGIIVHIIVVGYMLLGLNTVCDIYFCGALDEMVNKWHVKPDVAGATFMAAGGSAPELFTSLIGAVITENDVGFGTIVGSAVFNVLAVIGACGIAVGRPGSNANAGDGEGVLPYIELSWWPLFRDCVYYLYGLGLLAYCAYGKAIDCPDGSKKGAGAIELHEAIILFLSYIVYCTLMYFNEFLEAWIKQWIKQFTSRGDKSMTGQIKVAPIENAEDDDVNKVTVTAATGMLREGAQADDSAPPGQPEHHIGRDQPDYADPESLEKAGLPMTAHGSLNVPSMSSTGNRLPSNNSGGRASMGENSRKGHHIDHHIRLVHNKVHHTTDGQVTVVKSPRPQEGSSPRPDGKRRPSKGSNSPRGRKKSDTGSSTIEQVVEIQKDRDSEGGTKEELDADSADGLKDAIDGDDNADNDSDVSDDVAALMIKPDNPKEQIIWYLSLPIYAPLYYCIPKPSPTTFLFSFGIALLFIGGFSFILVYCVELFGKAILGGGNNVTIVMSFTLLAAGTSIPDLVSSMAVARAGEGDMAVSSSIGSNIFDILVGLPIPWMIKILIVEIIGKGNKGYAVKIKSPYIALYVLLLLFMVFCVICSIHLNGWRLNRYLGYAMAGLYCIFLGVVLPVEILDKGPYI